tara:strand:+ start:4509 stop:5483 length:975 start_codon:yes stop_codon:yes gene_type:complete
MKRACVSAGLLFAALMASSSGQAQEANSTPAPIPNGPYLGQMPPGATAKPFAPGIVNTEKWGDAIGFSLDLNEIYVSRWRHSDDVREPESVTFKQVGNIWRKIAVPAGTDRPFHSPDGKTLHFKSQYKERTKDGWSEMKSLGPAFEAIGIMGLKSSAKGTLVLDERGGPAGDGIIRYSRLIDGKREDPKPFGKEINSGTWNAHPYIAPDESYVMWDGERERAALAVPTSISASGSKTGRGVKRSTSATRSTPRRKKADHRSRRTGNISSSTEWCRRRAAMGALSQTCTGWTRRLSKRCGPSSSGDAGACRLVLLSGMTIGSIIL